MITDKQIIAFVKESNAIEGINRVPLPSEIKEFKRFLVLDKVTLTDIVTFVAIYQPNARLRDRIGLDVWVGNHKPPRGCPEIREQLIQLLDEASGVSYKTPFQLHVEYETLHPFTDGNGRSGRALWAWQMQDLSLGFLHRFYYQSLDSSRIDGHTRRID